MGEIGVLILLYGVAVLLLTAEVFIPSHGVLTFVGVAFLVMAIVRTFQVGQTAGTISIIATVVLLPAFVMAAVKIWPNTWIGRKIAPDNPVYTAKDFGAGTDELLLLVNTSGRTLTPLRPVGTCEFDGKRIQCICESGMIDSGKSVRAIGVRGRSLEVRLEATQDLNDSSGAEFPLV